MNIKDNITNYLYDKQFLLTLYDDNVYFFNYKFLNKFSNDEISIHTDGKIIKIIGENLRIIKITKDELLVQGIFKNIEVTET